MSAYPLGYFEVPEVMKSEPCDECGAPGCDVLVQVMAPGGAMLFFHQSCLDAVIETADALEDETE